MASFLQEYPVRPSLVGQTNVSTFGVKAKMLLSLYSVANKRLQAALSSQTRAAGATYGVIDIDIHPDLDGDDYADAVLASL